MIAGQERRAFRIELADDFSTVLQHLVAEFQNGYGGFAHTLSQMFRDLPGSHRYDGQGQALQLCEDPDAQAEWASFKDMQFHGGSPVHRDGLR
ncbi:hypothetical protein RA20_15515 [Leisingera sp. ANG-Vp]|nr:hypothetical protein RA20_15515 [Leisingera sp. ANG-Vp]